MKAFFLKPRLALCAFSAFFLVAVSAFCVFHVFGRGSVDGSLRHVLILQTSDLHSHIGTGVGEGDWLILAGIIDRERAKAGGAGKVLLVDCGDTLPGTFLGSMTRGGAAVEMLNALHYDIWVPGNHDFEFGPKRFAEVWESVRAAKVAANLEFDGLEVPSWTLIRKNGVGIAVIGMTAPYLRKWLWGRNIKGIGLRGVYESLDRVMPEVAAADPDMTILAIHQGRFPPARLDGVFLSAIAERYPQLDLILGGHSHQLVPGERLGKSRVWYVEPGGHGVVLGRIDATIDVKRHRVVNLRSKLIPVAGNRPEMAVLPAESALRMSRWLEDAGKLSRRKICRLKRRIGYGSGMRRLFQKAMMAATGAEVAFSGVIGRNAGFAGEITEGDVFDAVPYEDTVCVLRMSRGDFLGVAQEQLDAKRSGRGALSWSGIRLERSLDGSPRLFFREGGEWRSDSEKRVPVAFSSYDLASAGGRYPVLAETASRPECRGEDSGTTVREAVLRWLEKGH